MREMTEAQRENLRVIDTENALTKEELRELKRIAHASQAARWLIAIGIAVVGLVGIDHIIDFVQRHWK
jgi:hypothetical protein